MTPEFKYNRVLYYITTNVLCSVCELWALSAVCSYVVVNNKAKVIKFRQQPS